MNIYIIGNGRITLSLVKELVWIKEIENIFIYSRKHYLIENGKCKCRIDRTFEDILNIYLTEQSILTSVSYVYYDSLSQLSDISRKSGKRDLLILAVKFNLNELFYIDKDLKIEFDLDNYEHIKLLKAKLNYFDTNPIDLVGQDGEGDKDKINSRLQSLKAKTKRIEKEICRLSVQTSVGYERLYNLRNSTIGIINLGIIIKDFNGIIFNMINEIDITNWLLMKIVGISFCKLISPCENDSLRAKYFLQNKLQQCGIKVNDISLEYIGPHNHNGFIPTESIYINGLPYTDYTDEYPIIMSNSFLSSVIEDTNSFGEKVFTKKGSSDEDTILCLYKAVKQYIYQDNNYYRASIYIEEYDCFTGVPIILKNNRICIKDTIKKMTLTAKKKFENVIDEQKMICYDLYECIT